MGDDEDLAAELKSLEAMLGPGSATELTDREIAELEQMISEKDPHAPTYEWFEEYNKESEGSHHSLRLTSWRHRPPTPSDSGDDADDEEDATLDDHLKSVAAEFSPVSDQTRLAEEEASPPGATDARSLRS